MFITAAHVLSGAREGDNLLFGARDGWLTAKINSIFADPDGYDVAAFSCENKFQYDGIALGSTEGIVLGAKLQFLGFPLGMQQLNVKDFPLAAPLVRTAHLSGSISVADHDLFILDGFNNKGYSGGPVFVMDEDPPRFIGVISGYRYDRELVVQKKNELGELVDADYFVRPNSGMIQMVGAEKVNQFLLGEEA